MLTSKTHVRDARSSVWIDSLGFVRIPFAEKKGFALRYLQKLQNFEQASTGHASSYRIRRVTVSDTYWRLPYNRHAFSPIRRFAVSELSSPESFQTCFLQTLGAENWTGAVHPVSCSRLASELHAVDWIRSNAQHTMYNG